MERTSATVVVCTEGVAVCDGAAGLSLLSFISLELEEFSLLAPPTLGLATDWNRAMVPNQGL